MTGRSSNQARPFYYIALLLASSVLHPLLGDTIATFSLLKDGSTYSVDTLDYSWHCKSICLSLAFHHSFKAKRYRIPVFIQRTKANILKLVHLHNCITLTTYNNNGSHCVIHHTPCRPHQIAERSSKQTDRTRATPSRMRSFCLTKIGRSASLARKRKRWIPKLRKTCCGLFPKAPKKRMPSAHWLP